MTPANTLRGVLAAAALLSTSPLLASVFPHTPDSRPVPAIGTAEADVIATFGQPTRGIATQDFGNARIDVWDFGTFRVFLRDGKVIDSRRW